ncbi:hypothetical protein FJT64_011866 [Amphibalanus amphitrite]|uniref:Uncharacterized protein n=1 Tax=Amphibalanus amphitrite TaxID=1232801 RepID=A0A6A4V857_AMPAM|nr:hypothetical protein FJT64_011866 [Amphibalanus amphitrite]
MAKRKSRSSSRHFSSTFRVNLSRSSLNKVMPRKDFEVTDEGALKELPPEIVRLVEEMLAESPDNSQERNESPEPGQKQQVTVSVWDWSGDPEYEAVLLPLLGYRGVYLLVFDASQPLDGPATIATWAKGQVRARDKLGWGLGNGDSSGWGMGIGQYGTRNRSKRDPVRDVERGAGICISWTQRLEPSGTGTGQRRTQTSHVGK